MRPLGETARAWCSRLRDRGAEEDGFTIVEVVVTGLVVVAAMIATFGALEAAGRAGSEQRHHTISYSLAQQDQARMRSLRVSELFELDQTREVVQDGTAYSVHSTASYVNSSTGTASCAEGESPADYIAIRTTVSWPSIGSRPPTAVESIITPPNGAFGANRGTLVIAVRNAADEPIAGMPLSGSGAGSFSGQTNENGCAVFPNLPAGDYSLVPSTATGVVDRDGEEPGPTTVSVVDQSTNTVVLLFDSPGWVDVSFTTRIDGTVQPVAPTAADSVIAFNTGMTVPKVFPAGDPPQDPIHAGALFPFTSPDTIYAGACETNNPNPTGIEDPPASEAMAHVNVTGNETVDAEVQLPALDLLVRKENGNPIPNAKVVITDNECEVGGQPVKRTYVTDASGGLPNPGLPYGNYSVCASAELTWQQRQWSWFSGWQWYDVTGYRREVASSVDVKTTDTDTQQTVTLTTPNSDGNGGSQAGQCT